MCFTVIVKYTLFRRLSIWLVGLLYVTTASAARCSNSVINSIRQYEIIVKFRYIKIQPKTIYLSTKPWRIIAEFVGFIPHSLVLRSIVLGCILLYRNWSIYVVFVTFILVPTFLRTADETLSQEWSEHRSTLYLCFLQGIHT